MRRRYLAGSIWKTQATTWIKYRRRGTDRTGGESLFWKECRRKSKNIIPISGKIRLSDGSGTKRAKGETKGISDGLHYEWTGTDYLTGIEDECKFDF